MLIAGIIIVFLASILHCWYAANRAAVPGHQAMGFLAFGSAAVILSFLMLIGGAALVAVGGSLVGAVVVTGAYFLLFPIVLMPIMRRVYRPAPRSAMSESEWERVAGVTDSNPHIPSAGAFWTQLEEWFAEATERGESFVDISAGDLHRRVGGYPSRNHRMPVCCSVMKKEMRNGDLVMDEPPRGLGATFTVRYKLPR